MMLPEAKIRSCDGRQYELCGTHLVLFSPVGPKSRLKIDIYIYTYIKDKKTSWGGKYATTVLTML